jgi:hypothetical protein
VLLIFAAQGAIAESASYTPRPVSRILWIGFQNGQLSLEAKNAPAQEVLDQICAKAEIFLQASAPLKGSVTASFKDLPVEQALRRLFGADVSFIFLYPKQKATAGSVAVPSDVWVLAKGAGEASKTSNIPDSQETTAASQNSMQEIEGEFERNPMAAWNAAIGSRSNDVRLKAIAHLGKQPTRDSVDVLMKVVLYDRDAEPVIQQSALDALTGLAQTSPQIQEILAQQVENVAGGPPVMRQLAADILGIQLEPTGDQATSDQAPQDGEQPGAR